MRAAVAVALLLAGMTSAADIQLRLDFADTTESPTFSVPDSPERVQINFSKAVEGVFITPPFDNGFSRVACHWFDLSGELIQNVEVGTPTEDPIDPVEVIGFVQCNTE